MNDAGDEAELAPLPREQIGPFLILGIDKDADATAIEAAWARRVIQARKGQTRTPLTDIHWAREVLRDSTARLAADADSLNPDTARGDLAKILADFHLDSRGPNWEPYEPEAPLSPPAELPEAAAEMAEMTPPSVPLELSSIAEWLDRFTREPLDPWGVYFSEPEPLP